MGWKILQVADPEQTRNDAIWKVFGAGHGFSAFAYDSASFDLLQNRPLSSFIWIQ